MLPGEKRPLLRPFLLNLFQPMCFPRLIHSTDVPIISLKAFAALIDLDDDLGIQDQKGSTRVVDFRMCTSCYCSRSAAAFVTNSILLEICNTCRQRNGQSNGKRPFSTTFTPTAHPAEHTGTQNRLDLQSPWGSVLSTPQQNFLRRHRTRRERSRRRRERHSRDHHSRSRGRDTNPMTADQPNDLDAQKFQMGRL